MDIKLFPNPLVSGYHDKIFVDTELNEQVNVSIYNMSGVLLKREIMLKEDKTIEFIQGAGIYFVLFDFLESEVSLTKKLFIY